MIKDVHTCIMDLTRCQGTPSFEVTQAHHKWSAIYVTWRYICMMVQQKETRCSRLKRRKLQSKPFPLPKRFMVIMHTKLSWRPKTLLVCFDNENSTLSITQKWVQKWINTYVHNLSATFYDNYLHCLFEDRIWAGRVWSLTTKGQLDSKLIYEGIFSPKMPTKNLKDFCPTL